ncbi:MAG: hypothetical protein ABIH39_01725 [Candidatus Margulisiibacteriota bacterium]
MTDFQKSIDRAISLQVSPSGCDKYTIIKIQPIRGGCCCSGCWPITWQEINNHISPAFVSHEGDAIVEINNEKFVLESHESGAEIVFLGVISGLIASAIFEGIKLILKARQKEIGQKKETYKIVFHQKITNGNIIEKTIEVTLPINNNKELNESIMKLLSSE